MDKRTTIQIEKSTLDRLQKIEKLTKLETYDEILNRVLDKFDKIK